MSSAGQTQSNADGARQGRDATGTKGLAIENVTLVKGWLGSELRCAAGQALEPRGCERHSDHYLCKTCEGWFGVPHDGIHTGPDKHPTWRSRDCVCRPCREAYAP